MEYTMPDDTFTKIHDGIFILVDNRIGMITKCNDFKCYIIDIYTGQEYYWATINLELTISDGDFKVIEPTKLLKLLYGIA